MKETGFLYQKNNILRRNSFREILKTSLQIYLIVLTAIFFSVGQIASAKNQNFSENYVSNLIEENKYAELIQYLEPFVDRGNPSAQYWYGNIYEFGLGKLKDEETALEWYLSSARQGNRDAQFSAAMLLSISDIVPRNHYEAKDLFEAAARQGHVDAQVTLGYLLANNVLGPYDPETAVFWLSKAASAGNQDAQYRLGEAYLIGQGVVPDVDTAIYWLETAAAQGNVKAQLELGSIYSTADSGVHDYGKSYYWYNLAAQDDDLYAIKIVGFFLWEGLGVERNKRAAIDYFKRAYEKGDLLSQAFYGFTLYEYSFNSEKLKRNSLEILKDAASRGSGMALYFLIDIFERGSDLIEVNNAVFSMGEPETRMEKWFLVKSLAKYYFQIGLFDEAASLRNLELAMGAELFGKDNSIYAKSLGDAIRAVARSDTSLGGKESLDLRRELLLELSSLPVDEGEIPKTIRAFLYFVLAEERYFSGKSPEEPLRRTFEVLQDDEPVGDRFDFIENKGFLTLTDQSEIIINLADLMTSLGHCQFALSTLNDLENIWAQEKVQYRLDLTFNLKISFFDALLCLDNYERAAQKLIDASDLFLESVKNKDANILFNDEYRKFFVGVLKYRIFNLHDSYHFNEKLWDVAFQLSFFMGPSDLKKVFLSNFANKNSEFRVRYNVRKLLNLRAYLWPKSKVAGYKSYEEFLTGHLQRTKFFEDLLTVKDTIEKNDPLLYQELFLAPPRVPQVQKWLKADEGAVTFYLDDDADKAFLFFIGAEDYTFTEVQISPSELQTSVETLRSQVSLQKRHSLNHLPRFNVKLANELFVKLLGPVEFRLRELEHLYFVPAGSLESLPISLLVTDLNAKDGNLQEGINYSNVEWLAKSVRITRLPTLVALKQLDLSRSAELPSADGMSFIGFGDPVLNGSVGNLRGLEVVDVYEGAKADLGELRALPELPETGDELRKIAKYLGASRDNVFLREKATETAVKSTSLNQSGVVAFATHGLISGELSGLAEPALVMTPPDKATEFDDAGKELGASGLSGLARSFIYAGARSLLVTHWSVDSRATTKLTTGMFEAMALDPSIGRAEALRQSMLSMMNDADNPHYAHPAFWAPFSLIGDGQTAN
jgi:TPR repeat protein/CHAT domain-containing protein